MSNIINILSIDLDAFWESSETIYVNNSKKIVPNHLEILDMFKKHSYKETNYGIDHNELIQLIDRHPDSKFNIYNYDAHHDLYALNNNIWLNPLKIRGKKVDIGNMFFQLMREDKIIIYNWIVNTTIHNTLIEEVKQNIGKTFFKKVNIITAESFTNNVFFDHLFISISPEWIPKNNLNWIISMIKCFKQLTDNDISDLKQKVSHRWSLGDDNILINADRFYFNYEYVK